MKTSSILTSLMLASSLLCAGASAQVGSPRDPLDEEIELLAELGRQAPWKLEEAFAQAEEPGALPAGSAVGTHVVPGTSQVRLPRAIHYATFNLWRAKLFYPAQGMIYDDVPGPNTRAKLFLGSFNDVMNRFCRTDSTSWGDGRRSVITDYSPFRVSPVRVPVVGIPKRLPWIDELRRLPSGVWLGRSYYDCKFWGYVILRFVP